MNEKSSKQIKGVALVTFVKVIRADKSGVYDKYLKEEDLQIVKKRIVDQVWYPYETFKRCFSAVYEIIGKKNEEKVLDWGRLYAEAIMATNFKITIKENKPLEHIKRIPGYLTHFFDFGTADVKVEDPNRVFLKLSDLDPNFPLIYIFLQGWFQRVAELCGAKNVQCEFIDKSWVNNTNTTSYRITWSQ
jgi:hypothetical protein